MEGYVTGGVYESRYSIFALNRELSAYVLKADEGIHVSIFGGDRTHIGAVSIIAPDGSAEHLQFPSHRDGVIAGHWAEELSKAGFSPVVVEVGIHYDHIDKAGIETVVRASNALLARVLAH